MSYAVKELVYTLQGEGANAGRAAVFCRFAGCNLWSGQEADRVTATCAFCDTDFVGTDGTGGGRFESAETLADAVAQAWSPALDANHEDTLRRYPASAATPRGARTAPLPPLGGFHGRGTGAAARSSSH
jgi:hypothetical protein